MNPVETPASHSDTKELDPHDADPAGDGNEPIPELEDSPLLSCFDAIGRLLRGGFFVALCLLLLPSLAGAHGRPPPARVWIDGHDIDGPPPGPEHVPMHLGGSVWPVMISSKINSKRTGEAAAETRLESSMGLNGSVFAHHGYYSAQLDIVEFEQTTEDPFVLAGSGFAPGSTFVLIALSTRVWREIHRFDAPWGGHYHVDFGIRYTLSGNRAEGGGRQQARNSGFLCPELVLQGVKVIDDRSAIHTRTSFASNGATTGRETSAEFSMLLNTHLFETPWSAHDVSIGVRGLTSKLGFTDKGTGQETTVTTTYLGPEFSYAVRW